MDQKLIMTQMIKLNRAAFETAFNTVALFQNQAEMIGRMFIEQAEWMPQEGRKVSEEWINICKKGREDFKKAVDDGLTKAEAFFTRA